VQWRLTVEFLREKLWGKDAGPDAPHYLQ